MILVDISLKATMKKSLKQTVLIVTSYRTTSQNLGLHCQRGEYCQAKLVRALVGKVLDVVVDIRKNSPTFGQHVAVELSDENQRQLFMPHGCLHGFSVLSETAIFAYKVDNFYNKESEWGMRYDAPEFNIDWKIPADKVLTSEKDRIAHSLKDVPDFSL